MHRPDAHDLDTGTVEGAHRSGALLQQGRRDAGDSERRRSRQRAGSRATASRRPARRPATAWRSSAKFGKKSGTVTASEFSDASLEQAMRNAEEIARLSPDNPEAMPVLGPQTYTPVKAYFDDAASATPGVARRLRAHRDRHEQAEGRRVGGLRRDLGADAGGRDVEGAVRLRPVQRRRLQPDGAHAGRHRIGLGVTLVQRAAAAGSAEARGGGDRQGRAIAQSRRPSSPASTPSSSSRPRWPICSSRWRLPRTRVRPTKGAASSRRKAAARASASRSSVRRSGSIPIRRIRLAPAVRSTAQGLPLKRIVWVDRRRAEEPVVLALLGAEAGQGSDRAAGQPDHGRRQRDDGRPDQGRRARDPRDAVLVYPLARSADAAASPA